MRPIAGIALVAFLLSGCDIARPARPDRSGQERVPWILTAAAGNRLELAAMTGGPDCHRFAGVDASESDGSIELMAWVEVLPNDGCFLALAWHRVTVDLALPFGLRPLEGCMIEQSGMYKTRGTCGEIIDL